MKTTSIKYAVVALLALCLIACETLSPATVQNSPFDKNRIDGELTKMVQDGDIIGGSALIFAGGQEQYFGAFGLADREANRPWTRQSLANIYSMTKPVTGVTLMTLYEDGLFQLDDPISKYLPEFKDGEVLTGTNDQGQMITEPVRRPVTIKDLMRHTSGLSYAWSGSPIDQAMRDADLLNPGKPLSEFSQDLSKIPLNFQPGTQWRYSVSVDVQARLAEVISGQPYEKLVQSRVLGPLGMTGTGYFVPPREKDKVTAIYMRQDDGSLLREADEDVYGFWPEKPTQINGGHGLIASIDDYMRFAKMLLNKGTLEGVQILKPETIALMSQNHLPEGLTDLDFLPGKGQMGFGLNFAVRIAPPIDDKENPGEVGEFFWDGRASTLFWIDPKNDLAAVFFVQIIPFDGDLHYRFRKAVYEALKSSGSE